MSGIFGLFDCRLENGESLGEIARTRPVRFLGLIQQSAGAFSGRANLTGQLPGRIEMVILLSAGFLLQRGARRNGRRSNAAGKYSMFRSSAVFCVLLIWAGQARASWADSLFEETFRDFGSVPRGAVLTYPFRVVNNTGVNVHIASVRVSCGCTSARAVESSIPAGKESAVVVQMDTRRFFHTKSVTVYVQFSQPRFEEVRLIVQANSRDDVAVMPDTLAFGKVKPGRVPTSTATITFLGVQGQVTEVKSDSNFVKPAIKETRRQPGELTYELAASLRSDTPVGKWFTELWLQTDNPNMPKVRVPVTVEIDSPLSVTPNKIALGQVKRGTESDRKVILRGARPFRITQITGTDRQIQIRKTSSESKTVHVLTVTLRPNQAGELNRTIRVQTDLKSDENIEFTAQAEVID
jgi:hypothetical protein